RGFNLGKPFYVQLGYADDDYPHRMGLQDEDGAYILSDPFTYAQTTVTDWPFEGVWDLVTGLAPAPTVTKLGNDDWPCLSFDWNKFTDFVALGVFPNAGAFDIRLNASGTGPNTDARIFDANDGLNEIRLLCIDEEGDGRGQLQILVRNDSDNEDWRI